tara:strand:- start:101127 stop:103403 length:2277 start_codon:yes stop_codon:yes gene_type:complete
MRVFIAEKPELGRAIAEALGGGSRQDGFIRCGSGDIVTWCFGHLLTLTDPEDHDPSASMWTMNSLPLRWPVQHKPIDGKSAQINIIKTLTNDASEIIHAGDPDDEGQLLVDEVLDYIGNKKPVKRILINDLNKKIVQKALATMRDNSEFFGMYQSALARSVSDQLYGYNLTRAYTIAGRAGGVDQVLSVGRVQTPILGLVVRRDRAHENHNAHFYHDINAIVSDKEKEFRAKYRPAEGVNVDKKGRLLDGDLAQEICTAIKDQPVSDKTINKEDKESAAPLPYNLLNLQIDASRKFGYAPDKTLKLTQTLREKHRLITYNRSDCQYLSDEHHDDAPRVLDAIAKTAPVLAKAAGSGDPAIKSRAFNSKNVSAHHAIIPTEKTADLSRLEDGEAKLYLLIARAYIAQFFPKYGYCQTTIDLTIAGYDFRSTARVTTVEGWKKLYRQDKDNDAIEDDAAHGGGENLDWVMPESELFCRDIDNIKKETKPPAPYTMAALLKDLTRVSKYITDPKIKKLLLAKDQDKKGEQGGIGTPATRSAIIAQLINRGFISEKKKKVTSTTLGREFHDLLPEAATSPNMTALWHEQQQEIKEGRLTMLGFVDGIAEHVAKEIDNIKTGGLKIVATNLPKCGVCDTGYLRRKKGKKGFFWGCGSYPECGAIYQDKRGKPMLDEEPHVTPAPSADHLCPDCNKGLIRRPAKSKGNFWWGCSGFPACTFRAFDKNGSPVLIKPQENAAESETKAKPQAQTQTQNQNQPPPKE